MVQAHHQSESPIIHFPLTSFIPSRRWSIYADKVDSHVKDRERVLVLSIGRSLFAPRESSLVCCPMKHKVSHLRLPSRYVVGLRINESLIKTSTCSSTSNAISKSTGSSCDSTGGGINMFWCHVGKTMVSFVTRLILQITRVLTVLIDVWGDSIEIVSHSLSLESMALAMRGNDL